MSTKLMKLADKAKTTHGYKLSNEIREIALNIRAIESASLWARVKWVFTGVNMDSK